MRKFAANGFSAIVVLLLPLLLQWIVLHSSKAMNKKPFYCHFNSISRRFSFPCPEKLFCSPILARHCREGKQEKSH
jgi:hypothetical protein